MLYLCHRSPLPPTIQQSTPTPEQHSETVHTLKACIFFNKSPRWMHMHREGTPHTNTGSSQARHAGVRAAPVSARRFLGLGTTRVVLKAAPRTAAQSLHAGWSRHPASIALLAEAPIGVLALRAGPLRPSLPPAAPTTAPPTAPTCAQKHAQVTTRKFYREPEAGAETGRACRCEGSAAQRGGRRGSTHRRHGG